MRALFDQLFPHVFAGPDALEEIAPEGWDHSPLLACFHPLADLGTFRGASAFLDEYLTVDPNSWLEGDDGRFYLGPIWVRNRADLTPVYAMIFRRLHALGADWIYHFPELYLVELAPLDDPERWSRYSVTEAAAATLKTERDRADVEPMRTELSAIRAHAREEAMDRLPPATIRAYRQVYGRDPLGLATGKSVKGAIIKASATVGSCRLDRTWTLVRL